MKIIPSFLLILGTLGLAACVTMVPTTDVMPEPGAAAEGAGTVIGSIVMTTPTGVTDPDQMEMIDALREKRLTATIRRYVMRISQEEGGEFGWRDYVGDEYTTTFDIDTERRFVVTAPAGKYAVLEIMAGTPDISGSGTGANMREPAQFEIHAGKTTYVGRLVVQAQFKSATELKMAKAGERADGKTVLGMPERWLDMSLTATDTREQTLGELVKDPARAPAAIETEIMKVGVPRWQFVAPRLPPPPPPVHGKK